MSTDALEIRLGQNVNMYTNRLCHLLRNGFVSIYIRMIVLLLIIILQFKNSYDYEISQKR
jgi:hypothetical protein